MNAKIEYERNIAEYASKPTETNNKIRFYSIWTCIPPTISEVHMILF
jgi:hypothetical protein